MPPSGPRHFDASYAGWDGTYSVGETLKNWCDAAADVGLKEPERLALVKDAKILTAKPTHASTRATAASTTTSR